RGELKRKYVETGEWLKLVEHFPPVVFCILVYVLVLRRRLSVFSPTPPREGAPGFPAKSVIWQGG
ncbi:MAG TPA: hypothetical protein PKZ70_08220, partial [Candidatus Atribacteria bacterium]|nr:hypothetical protein [Candidatus Atribacteria bacterium]